MSKFEEIKAIDNAVDKANDFIERAKELRAYLLENEYNYQSKFRASARRSSMDLSRLLTEFRKPK